MARRPLLTNDQILARARPVFLERGYGACTKHIASAVGLTWGAIALRFGDKETLFRRAMDTRPVAAGYAIPTSAMADLPALLRDLWESLAELWPRRLQYRLAAAIPAFPDEPPVCVHDLASALESLAHQGAVRRDVGHHALADLVVSLMTGEVVQRFIARDADLTAEASFIDGVMRLLRSD